MPTKNIIHSYTSADVFPVKVVLNKPLMKLIVEKGFIPPIHPQILPTNECNLNCGYCSCKDRDQTLHLDFDRLKKNLKMFRKLGMQAVTITGGGEPLLYPSINDLIIFLDKQGVKVGLVTNGILLGQGVLSGEAIRDLTWCRISASDERNTIDYCKGVVRDNPKVDWAISYVITSEPNYENIIQHVEYANSAHLSHIRLVSDLIDLKHTFEMKQIKRILRERGVSDELVIYQGRKVFTKGARRCFISLLKPVLAADGYIYPCCGAQYAMDDSSHDFPLEMRMGSMDQVERLYSKQGWFDGAKCDRCYYTRYNALLLSILSNVSHKEFV